MLPSLIRYRILRQCSVDTYLVQPAPSVQKLTIRIPPRVPPPRPRLVIRLPPRAILNPASSNGISTTTSPPQTQAIIKPLVHPHADAKQHTPLFWVDPDSPPLSLCVPPSPSGPIYSFASTTTSEDEGEVARVLLGYSDGDHELPPATQVSGWIVISIALR